MLTAILESDCSQTPTCFTPAINISSKTVFFYVPLQFRVEFLLYQGPLVIKSAVAFISRRTVFSAILQRLPTKIYCSNIQYYTGGCQPHNQIRPNSSTGPKLPPNKSNRRNSPNLLRAGQNGFPRKRVAT